FKVPEGDAKGVDPGFFNQMKELDDVLAKTNGEKHNDIISLGVKKGIITEEQASQLKRQAKWRGGPRQQQATKPGLRLIEQLSAQDKPHRGCATDATARKRLRSYQFTMKICGACGHELEKDCFSNKQWHLSMQRRRCKECVGKQAELGIDDTRRDGRAETRPDRRCAGGASKGQTYDDEICSICLDVYDNPVRLSCGHSFCEVCLDGWHENSKYDVHQPRNCPVCRHRAKPSQEILSRLYTLSLLLESSWDENDKMFEHTKILQQELMTALLKMGHDADEIAQMVAEFAASHIRIPDAVHNAVSDNDAQTILDWMGSPVEEGKLESLSTNHGRTMLFLAALTGRVELATLLLQHGAIVDVYDSVGFTPIAVTLMFKTAEGYDELALPMLLYEWGASLEHKVPNDLTGTGGVFIDELLATTPMFQNELVGRRCEITGLNQRKDLIGQTCIVEKYIARKNRYKVTMEHAREAFLVGRDNLKRRDRTPDDPGYYITFEDGEYKHHTFASNEECQGFVRNLRSDKEAD
ncbi:hypothetical protein THAOC_34484, partial [Thalassiosira oceanica]